MLDSKENKIKLFLISGIFMLSIVTSFSQDSINSYLLKDTGLILFRPELYFIKTKETNFNSIFKNKVDTINAWTLGVPGDDAGNAKGFQDYLARTIQLDTSLYLTNLANNYDLYVEGWQRFYWTYGSIEYLKHESNNMSKNYIMSQ